MATKVTEVDELTSCPVSFEDFAEEGSQVPRILPCFHTLCEHCVEHLLQNNKSLECPECRQKHEASGGVKTFQQNKYIIAYLRKNRKSPPEVVASQERARCRDHGEDMIIFCRGSGCGKAICHLCLVKSHKFHDVVDLEEERKENYRILVKDIGEASKLLMVNKKVIQAFQERMENQYEKSLIMLKNRKEEVVRKITEHMDKLAAKLCEDKTDQDTQIKNEMETTEINMDMIHSLQDDVNEKTCLEDIKFKHEIVNNVCEETRKRNPNIAGYSFLEYTRNDQINHDTLEHLCGKTEKKEMPFISHQVQVSTTAGDEQNHEDEEINLQQNPDSPFQMRFPQESNFAKKWSFLHERHRAIHQISESSPKETNSKYLIIDPLRTKYRDSFHLKERLQIINQNVRPDIVVKAAKVPSCVVYSDTLS